MHKSMESSYDVASYAAGLADEFRQMVNDYLPTGFAQAQYVDPVSGENVVALKRVKPMPANFSNKAADVALNLRSALDQAAYAVSKAAGGKGRDTYFPIANSKELFEARIRKGSSEIPEAIFKVISSHTPFKEGDYSLWALAEICNSYKHREILRAQAVVKQSVKTTIAVGSSGVERIAVPFPLWNEERGELVVCRWRGGEPELQKYDLTAVVSFNFEGLENSAADGILLYLSKKVKRIIEDMNAEAIRLGVFS